MNSMNPKPLIALTTTVRVADTYLGPKTRLHGLGLYDSARATWILVM